MFVYLHGFNSSPAANKARLLRDRLAVLGRAPEFAAPALSHWPQEAIASVERLLAQSDAAHVTLVGSSLGGHYATWLAERHGCRAALVNPAVCPHALLAAGLGPQANLYTGEKYDLTPRHIEQLAALHIETITGRSVICSSWRWPMKCSTAGWPSRSTRVPAASFMTAAITGLPSSLAMSTQ